MASKVYHQTKLGPSQIALCGFIAPGSKVLEVGPATGYVTEHIRQELGCEVTAVEIDPVMAEQAAGHASRLIVGDISKPEIWDELGGGYDYVTFADVLEHLTDPATALRRSRTALKDTGCVLTSIPNVAYYKIRKMLLVGRFDYTDSGIMDNTHVRFYTERTVEALFASAGFRIQELVRIFRGKTDRRLHRLSPNAFTYQFVVKATPKG